MNTVTVIVPVYNKVKFLAECINSIISQELSGIEIICIDDGSTDGSLELLQYYESLGKIRLIQQQHSGAGEARNIGIDNANGEYVSFMDADDSYYDKYSLEKLYLKAKQKNVVLCAGNIQIFNDDGKKCIFKYHFEKEEMLNVKENALIYGQTSFIYKREFLNKYGLRYPRYSQFEDPPFLIKVMAKSGYYYCIPEIVYRYRVDYKKKYISYERAVDILLGVKDCFSIAYENNFYNLFKKQLIFLLYDLLEYYYLYALNQDVEIIKLLDDIGDIIAKFKLSFDNSNLIYNYNTFMEYVDGLKKLLRNLKIGVVIYGAGEYAKKVIDSGLPINLIGCAVTAINEDIYFNVSVDVKEIDSYSKDIFVLICANNKNREEMEKKLKELNFRNYDIMDDTKLLIMKELERCDCLWMKSNY